jgi:hypothetical protein
MNDKYTKWESLIELIYSETGISFQTGKCHPSHNGLSIDGKLPFSISECEFNYMKDFIIKHKLVNGYELATGTGISSVAIGYALGKNRGKLVTIDSYLEDEIQDQPVNDLRLGNSKSPMDRNVLMFNKLGLDNVKCYNRFSPNCEDILDEEFNKDIDFVFLDCPKDLNDFIRDTSILKERINKNKFAIFVHDTHCFPDGFKEVSKKMFGSEGIFIFDFNDSNGNTITQEFQLGLITNIEI